MQLTIVKNTRKKNETSDAQPEVLTDNAIETQHGPCNADSSLPNQIKLMNCNGAMKRRKIKAVIRYHTFNKRKEPELFVHHSLMLYYPRRDETTLCGS